MCVPVPMRVPTFVTRAVPVLRGDKGTQPSLGQLCSIPGICVPSSSFRVTVVTPRLRNSVQDLSFGLVRIRRFSLGFFLGFFTSWRGNFPDFLQQSQERAALQRLPCPPDPKSQEVPEELGQFQRPHSTGHKSLQCREGTGMVEWGWKLGNGIGIRNGEWDQSWDESI